MTKGAYIELIQRGLSGGETPADLRGKYHEKVISKYVEMLFNKLLFDMAKMAMAMRDSTTLDQYTKRYDIPKEDIKKSDDCNYSFELPATPPQMPGGQAIRWVGPCGECGTTKGWLYRSPTAHDVFSELDVDLVDQSIRYSPEGNTILLCNACNTDIPDCIAIKMITSFEDYEDEDNLPMPGGQDAEVFAAVVQLMMAQPPEELGNENVVNADSFKK
jgi:hypothetical protein